MGMVEIAEIVGAAAAVVGVFVAIGAWLFARANGNRASKRGIVAKNVHGNLVSGRQTHTGGTVGSIHADNVTLNQGLTEEDHKTLIRVETKLDRLVSNWESPRSTTPPGTSALAQATTPDTESFIDGALRLQSDHRHEEAIECLLDGYRKDLPPLAKAQLHYRVGEGFESLGRLRQAEAHFLESLKAGREAMDESWQAAAKARLGFIYSDRDHTLAEHYLKEALEFFENTDALRNQGIVRTGLAWLAMDQGDLDSTEDQVAKARDLFEMSNSTKVMDAIHGMLAIVERKRGHYDAASRHYDEAISISEVDGSDDVWDYRQNLAHLVILQNRLDDARQLIDEVLVHAIEVDDVLGQAYLYDYLGGIDRMRSDPVGAEGCHNKALNLAREAGSRSIEAEIMANLATDLAQQRRINDAKAMYTSAIKRFDDIGSTSDGRRLAEAGLNWLAAT